MTLLQCGCEQDGSARCAEHARWCCHLDRHAWHGPYPECPPCRIAKWRSVSLSADATPTRKLL